MTGLRGSFRPLCGEAVFNKVQYTVVEDCEVIYCFRPLCGEAVFNGINKMKTTMYFKKFSSPMRGSCFQYITPSITMRSQQKNVFVPYAGKLFSI